MAWALVQDDHNIDDSGGTSTTIVKAFTSNVTAGNLIVVSVAYGGTTQPSASGGGLTWADACAQIPDPINGQSHAVFCTKALSTGPLTVTVTWGSAVGYRRLLICEFSGNHDTVWLDQAGVGQLQASPGTGVDAATSGNITPTEDGCLVFGFIQNTNESNPASTVMTAGTGYTVTEVIGTAPGVGKGEYKTQVTAGVVAATFTLGATTRVTTSVSVFRPAAGGGGTPTLEQEGHQVYNDDGDEDSSTAKTVKNAQLVTQLGSRIVPRFLINAAFNPLPIFPQLEYRQGTSGPWIVAKRHTTPTGDLITGIEWHGNVNMPSATPTDYIAWSLALSGTTMPQVWPMTVIQRWFLTASQLSYWSHYFFSHAWAPGSFDYIHPYVGAHPYRDPAGVLNPGPEKWEISANAVDQLGALCVFGQWYWTVLRSDTGFLHRYHWNWGKPTQATDVVTYQDTMSGRSHSSAPAMFVGGNSWNPGNEVPKGILAAHQVYTSVLSDANVDSEIAVMGSAVTPWYGNRHLTPEAISDESGSGHHPVWVDEGNPPSYWEGVEP